jgi:hypothetical protein
MSLTLTPAPNGRGVILRDTAARREVYIAESELLTIGSALIQAAQERPERPPRYRQR